MKTLGRRIVEVLMIQVKCSESGDGPGREGKGHLVRIRIPLVGHRESKNQP